ncbi:MAG: NAD-dependent epimerase/dehydratase family protein [Planctomycetes bacterium]|nr:NAD-dependent epimerase/dehydratase family protein [Planctomycetota bacterium]
MRALVTGGAGFIGSHLCERLLKDGHRVDVIDDLSTGCLENIYSLTSNKNFTFVNDTILNRMMMYTLIDKVDMIYHLAGAVGVQLIVDEPVRTIETNIRGTEVVLEVALKFRKKVLITSTSEVYGKSENESFKEDQDCVLGATTYSRWSYACSKAIDEFLGLAYHRQYNLPVVLARLFNTVGERQTGQYGMVIPRFVQASLLGEPLTVYGDGKQTRCFAYVRDVIDGLLALANDPTAYGNVYNIGATEEVAIENLAAMIKEMTGSNSQIQYIPYEQAYGKPFDDMVRRMPNLEKISKKVGYTPKTSLKETLQIIIDYFRKKMENEL